MFSEVFETPRLLLKRPTCALAEAIYTTYGSDPRVTRYVSWPVNRSVSDVEQFLEDLAERTERGEEYAWAVHAIKNTQLLGMIGVRPNPPVAEVGYCLAYNAWGQGYATEAMQVLLPALWAAPEIEQVHAYCHTEHRRSARVLEKAGLRYASIARQHSVLPAFGPTPQDMLRYEATRPKGLLAEV